MGDNTLISGLDWSILPNERWAIVGTNGCGKSTLLKAITGTGGELGVMQKGTVSVMPGTRLGFLEQTAVSGATSTVKDEVMSRMVEYQTALAEVEAAEAGCTEGSESELGTDAACVRLSQPLNEIDLHPSIHPSIHPNSTLACSPTRRGSRARGLHRGDARRERAERVGFYGGLRPALQLLQRRVADADRRRGCC